MHVTTVILETSLTVNQESQYQVQQHQNFSKSMIRKQCHDGTTQSPYQYEIPQPYEQFHQWELECFQPMIREQPMYHYDSITQTHYHNQSPQSYASSNLSGPCPEGPEREDPNMNVTHGYLPLGPPIGLNEAQHQRTASFHSNMSYPMLRFLDEHDYYEPPYATEHASINTRFLSQDLHIQSQASKKVQKGTRRSKQSWMSMQSSSSAETSFVSWGLLDPVTEAGAWSAEGGNKRPGEGYALDLSGLEDFHINGDN
jgi:hypothetical protein